MITLEKCHDCIDLNKKGKILHDEWESPKSIVKKLDKKNFDIIVK